MFILAATEQVCRLARRQGHSRSVPSLRRRPRAADISPLDPLTAGAPQGTRYQLLRALRAMAEGQAMVVERRIPSLLDHFDNAGKRETWFRSLRQTASWEDQRNVEPILVPGTAFPGIIGRILLRAGWCAPSDQPHWVPNLRFFFLTDLGYKSFENAQAWWQSLTPLQRMRLMFVE